MNYVEIRSRIDSLIDKGCANNFSEIDDRMFFKESLFKKTFPEFLPVLEMAIMQAKKYYRTDVVYCTPMVNRTSPHPKIGSGGGYHSDSFLKPQFKSFLYLSDVLERNDGAFEVASEATGRLIKFLSICRFTFKIVGIGAKVNRYDFVEKFAFLKGGFNAALGHAGYFFTADTRIPHRGCPVTTQPRYMLTFYFYVEESEILGRIPVLEKI